MKRCDGCKFWVKDREEDLDGSCRRSPPTPFLKTVMSPITQQQGVIVLAYWPKTRPELWCGDYRGRGLILFCRHLVGRVIGFLSAHRRGECPSQERSKDILTDVSPKKKPSLN